MIAYSSDYLIRRGFSPEKKIIAIQVILIKLRTENACIQTLIGDVLVEAIS
jgi:hypothetical protein